MVAPRAEAEGSAFGEHEGSLILPGPQSFRVPIGGLLQGVFRRSLGATDGLTRAGRWECRVEGDLCLYAGLFDQMGLLDSPRGPVKEDCKHHRSGKAGAFLPP